MKETVLTLSILTSLLLLVAGAQVTNIASANFFPDPGPDLPRIYIRANGNVEPATAPIERAGDVYTLTSDIAMHTIVIQRDNIVLDGAGFLIEGNKSWMGTERAAGNNGIIVEGQHDISIKSFYFIGLSVGVRISDSSNINIANSSFDDAVVNMATPIGLIIEASSFVLIENNNFTRMQAITGSGTYLTIRGNIVTGGGIDLKGTSNTIENNQIETSFEALKIGTADLNIISSNRIVGEVSFLYCSNNLIFGNNITGMRTLPAIGITFGSNNTFFNNRIENNDTVIGLTQTVNNTFYANTFPANCSIRVSNFDIQGNVLDAESKFWGHFWDNGTTGNYWANHNGTDSNWDGIGDSPYMITAVTWDNSILGDVSFVAGQDNYPLMKPYDGEHNTAGLPQTEPWQTEFGIVAAIVTVIVFVSAGLLFYRKKHGGSRL
ncbi:MAG: right-handed parallel beta-helix repeat-containing protein [Candidatus Bathyarchaeia archaeon]|jgi:hypothetical protein